MQSQQPNNDIFPKWESSAIHPDKALKELGIGDYKDYQQDDLLADLLKGKRIAFVCPSPHLNGLNLGETIDSYDIVIRIGTTAAIPENLHEDCGAKTDIIIHSFNQLEIEEAYRNIDYLSERKFVMCAMASNDYLIWHDTLMHKLNSMGTPTQNVSDNYLYRVFKEVGTTCNVGFAGLLTILNYDFKEIFIAGMGFYNMGNYGNIYNSDYYRQVTEKMGLFPPNELRQITAEQARADLHRQQPQIDYLQRLLHRDNRISVDRWLKHQLIFSKHDISHIIDKDLFIDIDGILCISEGRFQDGPYAGEFNYKHSTPLLNNIDLVNELFLNNRITIWTARGQRTGKIDWSEFTKKQLVAWGVNYHAIRFDKPHFDLLFDDKSAFDKKTFIDQLKKIL